MMPGLSRLLHRDTESGGFDVAVNRAHRYLVHVESGLLGRIGVMVRDLAEQQGADRLVLVADRGAARHHLPAVDAVLERSGLARETVLVPEGESAKTTDGLDLLWHALHRAGTTRRTLVLGLGGGVVCDLTTAAAATYMRGIPYALLPTTLLAQVDAAVGGKGGADYQGAKNLIGAFHHPVAVFVDPELLRTLSPHHLSNGLAEVVKVALIADPALFALLEDGVGRELSDLPWEAIVRAALRAKLDLLGPDPFEQGDLRRLLNLGHCFGHPYEAVSGFRVPHGEAVAAGLAVATGVGLATGRSRTQDADRILALLTDHRLPITMPRELRPRVWDELDTVRRVRNGVLHLVVPRSPGRCTVVDDIPRSAFDEALARLDTWSTR
ncbi:3-dehydroquinate synthase family protein [Streptomyces sp. NPDC002623]